MKRSLVKAAVPLFARCAPAGVTVLALAILAGCSDEGDPMDGGVGLASGQDADPVVIDFPIAYVKRPLPVDEDGAPLEMDARELIDFAGGAELYLRDRASPTSLETDLTPLILEQMTINGELEPAEDDAAPQIDIRDLEVSYDGTKLLFAARAPVDPDGDEEDQPTWNIWQYDIGTDEARRLIESGLTAEQGHDISPHYLPDGRIIFSSTRQRRSSAVLLDEGKPQFQAIDEDGNEPAFVLHTMTPAGTDIQQVSFNQSHDQDPLVLQSGEVVFSRWSNSGNNDGIHLYRMRPDGSGLELLYGAKSHFTGTDGSEVQFLEPREMPDGRLLALVRPFSTTNYGGDIQFIDVANFVENDQPTAAAAGTPGPAQQPATINTVDTAADPSPGGRYASAFPLWDGTDRLLVSWSQCRVRIGAADTGEARISPCTDEALADPDAEPAPPLYGLWLYDLATDTQLPVLQPEEGTMYAEVVAAQPRPLPRVLLPGSGSPDEYDPALAEEGVGVIHIRSVYDIDGEPLNGLDIGTLADPAQRTADQRPRRFLRLTKAVSQPDEDLFDVPRSAFGPNLNLGMREILGYVPVEPDGSVKVKVPANVAFSLSILNSDGRLVAARHMTWLTVAPGEILECNGCHVPDSPASHGRGDAFEPLNQGALTTSQPFPNTNPAIFADFGETMAEARTRISCALENCAAMTPSVDIVYEDVWTDEAAAGRPRDASFAMRYADLCPADLAECDLVPPTSQACMDAWQPNCRITIHYEEHIHPIWSVPRVIRDEVDLSVIQDNTCTACHSPVDPDGLAQVPAAQLDLSDGPSPDDPDQFNAYRELLFTDVVQELRGGQLVDAQTEVIDPETGEIVLQTETVAPPARIRAEGSDFMAAFDAGGVHEGYLSSAELRLISEWLDIGAQYYNNPFAAPVD